MSQAKVSDRRATAIYEAVHEAIMQLRIELAKEGRPTELDVRIAQAGEKAADDAVKAYRLKAFELFPRSSHDGRPDRARDAISDRPR